MGTAVCLFAWAVSLGQTPEPGGWLLTPQLTPGLELVYSGTCTQEEMQPPGVQFQRSYRLDITILVLAARERHWDVAVLTRSQARVPAAQQRAEKPSAVRLETAVVDKLGRLLAPPGASLAMPLAGPPTVETGCFVEVPPTRLGRQQVWEVNDEGRPPRTWQMVGTEVRDGVTCIKLVGQQQSDDWDRPRADRTAWRRRDTVWIASPLNLPIQVERVIERRDPARREPTARTTVRYDLTSRFTYPGKLFEERRNEIVTARKFWEDAAPLLKQPAQYPGRLEALDKRIAYHLDHHPPTPYRQALLFLQHRVQLARRGELPAELVAHEDPVRAVRVGQRAPDFVATDLTSRDTVRLYRQLGRPLLLFFFCPQTDNGREVLRFARGLNEKHEGKVSVLGLAVTDNPALVRKQHADLRLSFPILDGQGLRLTFGVEATPRLLVLDGQGQVRGAYTGWGNHTAAEIEEEFRRCLGR